MKLSLRQLKTIIKENLLLEAEDGEVYRRRGDPYEYIVIDGKWHARKKGRSKWRSMRRFKSSIRKLNREFPDAIKKASKKDDVKKDVAPKKQLGAPSKKTQATDDRPTATNPSQNVKDVSKSMGIDLDEPARGTAGLELPPSAVYNEKIIPGKVLNKESTGSINLSKNKKVRVALANALLAGFKDASKDIKDDTVYNAEYEISVGRDRSAGGSNAFIYKTTAPDSLKQAIDKRLKAVKIGDLKGGDFSLVLKVVKH